MRLIVPKECLLNMEGITFELENMPLPSARTVEVQHEKRSFWWFFNLVPWQEKTSETVSYTSNDMLLLL